MQNNAMQNPVDLFNRHTLEQRRKRAQHAKKPAWFLHDYAANCVQERLSEINRTFTKPAIVTWRPESWQTILDKPAHICADTEILDLVEEQFDLILGGLTLHAANDPVGQLVQMRRALKPDGLMVSALFGGQTLHELRVALAEAETQIEGGISPRVFPMAEIRDLGGLLQRAGFALPVADSLTLNTSYETPLHLMRDLRAMGETNVLTQRRKTLRRNTLLRACEIYAQNFSDADGRINATFEIIFLTGWAPSDTQQKPLRPGSAQTRLADALGTTEYNPEKC